MEPSITQILNESLLIEDPNELGWLFTLNDLEFEHMEFNLSGDQLITSYYNDHDHIEIVQILTGDDLKKSLKRQNFKQRLIDDDLIRYKKIHPMLTIFINKKEYEFKTIIAGDQLHINETIRLSELDMFDTSTLNDNIEMNINELFKVIGEINLNNFVINWAVTLTTKQRDFLFHSDKLI